MKIRINPRMRAAQALAALLCTSTLISGYAELRPTPIVRAEITADKKMSLQKVEGLQASPSKPNIAAALQGQVVDEYSVPPNWPANISWKPMRHFGPFLSGSTLDKVQVHVDRPNVVAMIYNDFLAGHEDAEIFKKYYGATLPSTSTPVYQHVPGRFPTAEGPNHMHFELDQIRYTSRYGGSVQLLFKLNEDFEGEIVKRLAPAPSNERIVWDLKSLTMAVYVIPRADAFNPLSPVGGEQPNFIEFKPGRAVAYKVDDAGTRTPMTEDTSAQLREVLDAMKTWLSHALRTHMHDLVHGFIHSQFRDFIAATELVDKVAVTDGFIDLHTREAIPIFMVLTRIRNVALDTESDEEEIRFKAGAWHVYDPASADVDPPPPDTPMVKREFAVIDEGQGTPLETFGVFRVDTCNRLVLVRFWFAAEEEDDFPNPNDYFRNYVHPTFSYDCANLETLAGQAAYGVVSETTVEGMDLLKMETLEREGWFSFTTRVVLSRM